MCVLAWVCGCAHVQRTIENELIVHVNLNELLAQKTYVSC